jgi:hypothetical protein
MAIKNRKETFYTHFDPFKAGKQIGLRSDAKTKSDAKLIETMILRACRTSDYSTLDGAAREALEEKELLTKPFPRSEAHLEDERPTFGYGPGNQGSDPWLCGTVVWT